MLGVQWGSSAIVQAIHLGEENSDIKFPQLVCTLLSDGVTMCIVKHVGHQGGGFPYLASTCT